MSAERQKREKGFMESLSDFLGDDFDLTHEEVLEALEEEGVEINKLRERVNETVTRELTRRRLAWRDRAREKRLRIEEALESVKALPQASGLLDELKSILKGGWGEEAMLTAEAHFRKKQDLSEEDLEKLIKDLNDLRTLEDLAGDED